MSGPMSGGQQQHFQVDARSYLDQVKLQFGNQPQVYNDFLDIMTEWKSETIDTPGVINQLLNLFKGHPDLIVGFNNFLPPEYTIEVQCETINVHQPGQQVMSITALAHSQAVSTVNRQMQGMSIWDVALASQNSNVQKVGAVNHPVLAAPSASPAADHRSYHQSPRPQSETVPSSGPPVSQPQQQQQQQQQQSGFPVEFTHTINYVNKIKKRFQGQPDIYKQFLEILHTYRQEQRLIRDGLASGPSKPLTEREVYQQLANLFKHQGDLLAELGQFLPDANGASSYGVASFVGAVHHPALAAPSASPAADHRSYHQSPRPQSETVPSSGPPVSQTQQQQQSGQPVEFNHAINYVKKIKNRFRGQPDIYKQFLAILHTYRQEQRLIRDGLASGPSKPLTEREVYQQLANLFRHQGDLLAELGQFLPDANGASSYGVASFQKVGAVHHPALAAPSASPAADHRSYHQSPRPQSETVPSSGPPVSQPQQQQQQQSGQPVEFNHAINYMNKIKKRFQGQPDIYKQFLEILHTYHQAYKLIRDGLPSGPSKPLTEREVYQQVANLFKHQEDLLAELGQFLSYA